MGRIATVLLALLALGACTSGDDDDSGAATATVADDSAGATEATAAAADTIATAGTAPGGGDQAQEASGAAARPGRASVSGLLQLAGPSIAIEARATLRADDVRGAVDELTAAVVRRGGWVASADVDFAPGDGERGDAESRATLVLAVPPAELDRMVGLLEDIGTLVSFDQLAEDVTEQLVDLDARIANTRASVERVRALLAEATDIQGIVRLESELTQREIELERLLAAQRQLDERVAMSTLTVEVVAAPAKVFAAVPREFEPTRPGLVEALADGWGAFVTGGYGVAFALATIAPFLVIVAVVLLAIVLIRRVTSAVSSQST
jgi:Domain of unknown function (DUF4349)